jgi:hypothetical protein
LIMPVPICSASSGAALCAPQLRLDAALAFGRPGGSIVAVGILRNLQTLEPTINIQIKPEQRTNQVKRRRSARGTGSPESSDSSRVKRYYDRPTAGLGSGIIL